MRLFVVMFTARRNCLKIDIFIPGVFAFFTHTHTQSHKKSRVTPNLRDGVTDVKRDID